MLGFAFGAAVTFYGRVAFMLWGREELGKRRLAAGSDERSVGSTYEFLQQIELGNQLGWALVMICCLGFIVCGGMWMRALKQRALNRGKKA